MRLMPACRRTVATRTSCATRSAPISPTTGADTAVIRELAGHADIRTTTIYTDVNPGASDRAAIAPAQGCSPSPSDRLSSPRDHTSDRRSWRADAYQFGARVVWTEVWTNLWTVSPHRNPPPPPLHLGFGGGPEPDYPPPTMCAAGSLARVLVFGCAAGAGAGQQRSWGRSADWFQRFGWGSKSTAKSTATTGETMRAEGAGVIVAASGLWGGGDRGGAGSG